jgi:hypothetical protein
VDRERLVKSWAAAGLALSRYRSRKKAASDRSTSIPSTHEGIVRPPAADFWTAANPLLCSRGLAPGGDMGVASAQLGGIMTDNTPCK